MAKKIGILGSGAVAKSLSSGFEKYGYSVKLGSRGEFSGIAEFAEMIVLAVKGSAAESALELAGAENLNGKTVIDATNPISDAPPEDGVLRFFTSLDRSLLEILQDKYPAANFVKAFSSVGNGLMVDPDFGDAKPSMFICGKNIGAKAEVSEVVEKFGWEVEDMGGVAAARAIEPLCILWCIPGFKDNQWQHAFKLLKK